MLPVFSLNTLGTRRLKHRRELFGGGDDAEIAWLSKVDHFDDRLGILRRQFFGRDDGELEYLEGVTRDVSFYEFFFKYAVVGGRISPFRKRVALHVLPGVSASCANVSHDGHAMYARKNVVAYWRLVDWRTKIHLLRKLELVPDPRLVGGTALDRPSVRAGSHASLLDRFLGIQDLVMAFDEKKRSEMIWERNVRGEVRFWKRELEK